MVIRGLANYDGIAVSGICVWAGLQLDPPIGDVPELGQATKALGIHTSLEQDLSVVALA